MPYKLSHQAAQDLEDIFLHGILRFGELQALKYQDSFKRIFELLAYMPSLGRSKEISSKDQNILHRFVHGSHVIYYRTLPNEIQIETILYAPLIKDIWDDDL